MLKLKIALISLVLCLAAGTAAQNKTGDCSSCHADLAKVLPKGHAPVQGSGVKACIACHNLGQSGEAKKNEFSAKVHLAHHTAKAGCSTCHAITPDKSFTLVGDTHSWGAPKAEDAKLIGEKMNSWAESKYTDHAHAKANVDCAGCHGKELPVSDSTVENYRCLACHGPVEKLAAKTHNAEFPKRNPHNSHLGNDIACTTCHKGHQASVVYCADCHKLWKMNVPGAGN
jgi:hypothetical protein